MNSTLIRDTAGDASEKAGWYREYSDKQPNNAEYAAAAEVYELLAKGRTLIDVGIAIREAGLGDDGRPHLALARADRKQVMLRWKGHSDTCQFDSRAARYRESWKWQVREELLQHLVESVNLNQRPAKTNRNNERTGYALVPMVPPEAMDQARQHVMGSLKDWHILWEVEKWSDQPLLAEPPTDPYLLRRIRGDLFEVLAEWDLTEVEKMVMAGRARMQA